MARRALPACVALPLVIVGAACAARAPIEPARGPDAVVEPDVDLRFESLQRLIAARGIRTLDTLVPLLPPSLRARHVVMFDSRSIQRSSAGAPRVVLFTRDAKFVVAFNGGSDGGADTLETMEFEDGQRAFRFRELAFDRSGATPPAASDVNPERCQACHGQRPQPVWDTYPTWPGAFGQQEHARRGAIEARALARFLGARGRARYGALIGLESLGDVRAEHEAAYEGRDRSSLNSQLGTRLQELDYLVIARRVIDAPGFGSFRYALLAALDARCPAVESFLPPAVRARFSTTYDAFARRTEGANSAQSIAKRARMRTDEGRTAARVVETLTPFRYVVEEGLGLPTSGWTLALEPDTYDFTTARESRRVLERELLEPILRDHPEVGELRGQPDRHDDYCAWLRRQSLARLSLPQP